MRPALQRKTIDGEKRLVHRLGADDRPGRQVVLNLVDATLQLGLQGVDVQSPLELYVYHTTAARGAALHHGSARHLLHRALQRFGDGNHHAVHRLLPCIGNDGDTWDKHFGKQVGLHPRAAVDASQQEQQAHEEDRLGIELMESLLIHD